MAHFQLAGGYLALSLECVCISNYGSKVYLSSQTPALPTVKYYLYIIGISESQQHP